MMLHAYSFKPSASEAANATNTGLYICEEMLPHKINLASLTLEAMNEGSQLAFKVAVKGRALKSRFWYHGASQDEAGSSAQEEMMEAVVEEAIVRVCAFEQTTTRNKLARDVQYAKKYAGADARMGAECKALLFLLEEDREPVRGRVSALTVEQIEDLVCVLSF